VPFRVSVRASREVELARALFAGPPAGHRVPRGVAYGLFPSLTRLSDRPFPGFSTGFILACRLSSSEFLRSSSRPLLSERPLPPRVSSLFATSPVVSTNAGLLGSRYGPPSGFLNLSAACSTTRLCGLVASRSHVQGFSVQGILAIHSLTRLVAGPCPLAVVARALTGKPAATRVRLDLEALLRVSSRSAGSVFSLPRGRSPLRFSSFRLSRAHRVPGFPGPSARGVSAAVCHRARGAEAGPAGRLQRVDDERARCARLRTHPPV